MFSEQAIFVIFIFVAYRRSCIGLCINDKHKPISIGLGLMLGAYT